MNDQERQEFDQALCNMRDTMPAMWWALYDGCKRSGFSDSQSLTLVYAHILSSCSGGINPGNPPPGEQEEE